MAARGQSLLAIAQKVSKNASPCTPLNPAVLAPGGMRRTAHVSFADATHCVCRRRIYDRPLLRSSARAEGAVRTDVQSMYDDGYNAASASARNSIDVAVM